MKKCSVCKSSKLESEFNKSSRNKDGLHNYCRSCQSNHYRKNKDRHMIRVRARDKAQSNRLRRIAYEYLKNGCKDCGEKNVYVLDFDHREPSMKKFTISFMIKQGGSDNNFIKEIEKCDVRCANCHRIRTESQRPSWRSNLASISALASNELKP